MSTGRFDGQNLIPLTTSWRHAYQSTIYAKKAPETVKPLRESRYVTALVYALAQHLFLSNDVVPRSVAACPTLAIVMLSSLSL